MKNKILIIIYLSALGTVFYFAYPIIKQRYFPSSEISNSQDNNSANENKKSFITNPFSENSTSPEDDIPDDSTVPDDVFIEISAEDCEENCEQFEDGDDKKYCQEYCGIQTESPISTDGCENLEDLEKDYCWKNQALTKKDFSFCKKIIDKKIFESCKNQLTENVLNSSNASVE